MGPNGLEPSTSRLSGVRSNQLSYGPIIYQYSKISHSLEWDAQALKTKQCILKELGDDNRLLNYRSTLGFCISSLILRTQFSLERRWSSRTFRYGYLVTTSPQSSAPPSATSSLRLNYRLRVLQTLMVWRAVCTRPGNVFTAVCWPAITSNSDFMWASFSPQSELGLFLRFGSGLLLRILL